MSDKDRVDCIYIPASATSTQGVKWVWVYRREPIIILSSTIMTAGARPVYRSPMLFFVNRPMVSDLSSSPSKFNLSNGFPVLPPTLLPPLRSHLRPFSLGGMPVAHAHPSRPPLGRRQQFDPHSLGLHANHHRRPVAAGPRPTGSRHVAGPQPRDGRRLVGCLNSGY